MDRRPLGELALTLDPRRGGVDRILSHPKAIGFDLSQVMAIAPFRDVARQLAERIRRYPGLRAGTIHTAQGKESDVVILVLGSDPAREGWMRQRYFDRPGEGLSHDRSRV